MNHMLSKPGCGGNVGVWKDPKMLQLGSSIFASACPTVGVSAGQLRAARALLGWSLPEAARRCGVSVSALLRAERGAGDAGASVSAAYARSGIRFTSDGVASER